MTDLAALLAQAREHRKWLESLRETLVGVIVDVVAAEKISGEATYLPHAINTLGDLVLALDPAQAATETKEPA